MKNLWKKAQKLLACTLALAFMLTMSAGAAEGAAATTGDNGIFTVPVNNYNIRFSKGTIVKEDTATLVIHKFSNDGTGADADGLPVEQNNPVNQMAILEGVKFIYYKVADLRMENTGGSVSLKYDLSVNNLKEVFDKQGQSVSDLATSNELNGALLKCNEDHKTFEKNIRDMLTPTLSEDVKNHIVTTNAQGIATAEGLPLGLYLVAEYEAPPKVQEETAPFLVSLPMTNVGSISAGTEGSEPYKPGSLWQYDVHVYPKNVESVPDIEKNIVHTAEDGTVTEEKYEGASVGGDWQENGTRKSVLFRIKVSIPKDIATMSKFSVDDMMSKGLTFKSVKRMGIHESSDVDCKALDEASIGKFDPSSSELSGDKSGEYDGGKKLTWDFITNESNRLKDVYKNQSSDYNKELVIEYEAVLNENCIVGGMGNPNGVKLVYNHSAGLKPSEKDAEIEHPTKSRVYTFGFSVTKTNGDTAGNEKMQGVKFKLYADEEMQQEIKMVAGNLAGTAEANNCYHPSTGAKNEKIVADMETGEDEKIYVWGLKPGTYYLKETATLAGYILLEEPIEIRLNEQLEIMEKYDGETSTYIQKPDKEQKYYKRVGDSYVEITVPAKGDTAHYNFGTDDIYTRSGEGDSVTYTKITSALSYPVLHIGENAGEKKTNASYSVVNHKRFAVPQTGGMGTWMFTVCGAVIIVAAAGLILIRRRRSMAK